MDHTTLFDVAVLHDAVYKKTVQEVAAILEERGYNPVNQIVGYFISGDPGYISSYKGAREKILGVDRSELLAFIIKDYLK